MREYAKRKGFTLIELLIVVVIIGILAMMMMLASDEAKVSARAAAIISDLETIKTAATAYYLDHAREINSGNWPGFDDHATELKVWDYLSTNTKGKLQTQHGIRDSEDKTMDFNYRYSLGGGKDTNWYVWCRVHKEERVREKLYARKEFANLVGSNEPHSKVAQELKEHSSGQHYVGMCIISMDIR